jgi:opacity protein-like surface antigen
MGLLKKLALPTAAVALALAAPKADAQSFYITGGLGALDPTDNNVQQVYGTMLVARGGIGLEDDNGWGAELDLLYNGGPGTPEAYGGATATSQWSDLGFSVRAYKAFGKRGKDIRPFIATGFFYDSATETLTLSYEGESASASASGGSIGWEASGGLQFPLTEKLSLELEARYNINSINFQENSYNGGGSVTTRSGVDTGGFSGIASLKFYF